MSDTPIPSPGATGGNPSAKAPIPAPARRAAVAGFAGTFIEYYDFALYGTLTVYMAPQFFPSDNSATSLLSGLAVLGAGFFARPIGAIIFGRIGDQRGRRTSLMLTVLMMGICSGLMGLLPTHTQIGMLAPVLLVLLRLGQGLSAGGEMLGSVTYAMESAPPSRRVLLSSLSPFGGALGGAAGAGVAAGLAAILPNGAMESYGWRIAFLISVPLMVIAYLIRHRLEDTPDFHEMVVQKEIVRSPLRETFTVHKRAMLIAAGVALAANGTAGMGAWFTTYLAGNRELDSGTVLTALAIAKLMSAMLIPPAGAMTDRLSQRKMITGVLTLVLITMVPILWVLGTATSFAGLLVGLFLFMSLCQLVTAPAFSFIAEIFPRNVRYTASNFGQNIGTVLGSGLTPLVAGALVLATGSWAGPALWVGGVATVGLVTLGFQRRIMGAVRGDAVTVAAGSAKDRAAH
ncbi:MFS transporter [Streptomyces sp. NPDC002896]|uniref:MFS transporter n=1 Tax=Streptomyces sp. NPDC002896 TaxID=3154438 RepID=UPI003326BF3F